MRIAGQSRKQLLTWLTTTIITVVAVAVPVASSSTFADIGAALSAFGKGTILEGLAWRVFPFFLVGLAIFVLFVFSRRSERLHLTSGLSELLHDIPGTVFKDANLTNASFAHTTIQDTDFSGATLDCVNWTHASFARCKFPKDFDDTIRILCTSRDGRSQDYSHVNLQRLHLAGVELVAANLLRANLNDAYLQNANLECAHLQSAQALGTNFSNAVLTGACIQHWGINADTCFNDVRCDYIYLEPDQQERRPSSGIFQSGDFAKLVRQFSDTLVSNTLDFLFRKGIEPQAFDVALQNLFTKYEDAGLSLHSLVDVGDGDRLVKLTVANPTADKAPMHAQFTHDYATMQQQQAAAREALSLHSLVDVGDVNRLVKLTVANPTADKAPMHAQFTHDYEAMQQQLEAAREKTQALQQDLAHAEGQLTVYREQSVFLQGFVYHQTDRFSRPSFNAPNSQFKGDLMPDNSNANAVRFGDVQGDIIGIAGGDNIGVVAGKDITGAAGGDISGTLTLTLGQLEATKDPEALKLADLLKQLKAAIEGKDAGLEAKDKEKALKHLDAIAKLGSDRKNPDLLERAGDALDALPTIVKRGNGLLEFSEKYLPTLTAGIKTILAAWGIAL